MDLVGGVGPAERDAVSLDAFAANVLIGFVVCCDIAAVDADVASAVVLSDADARPVALMVPP